MSSDRSLSAQARRVEQTLNLLSKQQASQDDVSTVARTGINKYSMLNIMFFKADLY